MAGHAPILIPRGLVASAAVLIEVAKYQVLPLDDCQAERFDAGLAQRAGVDHRNLPMLYPAMRRLSENAMLNLKNKSYPVTAEVVVPDGGAQG